MSARTRRGLSGARGSVRRDRRGLRRRPHPAAMGGAPPWWLSLAAVRRPCGSRQRRCPAHVGPDGTRRRDSTGRTWPCDAAVIGAIGGLRQRPGQLRERSAPARTTSSICGCSGRLPRHVRADGAGPSLGAARAAHAGLFLPLAVSERPRRGPSGIRVPRPAVRAAVGRAAHICGARRPATPGRAHRVRARRRTSGRVCRGSAPHVVRRVNARAWLGRMQAAATGYDRQRHHRDVQPPAVARRVPARTSRGSRSRSATK